MLQDKVDIVQDLCSHVKQLVQTLLCHAKVGSMTFTVRTLQHDLITGIHCVDCICCLSLQRFGLRGMSITPATMTRYIRQQQQAALTSARGGDPEEALQDFITDMEQLCSGAEPMLNHIHVSAIFSATAKTWVPALGNRNFRSGQ